MNRFAGLEAVTAGQIRKAIFNIPPGFAKSTLVSVLWPCWEWTFRPGISWMFATHSLDLTYRDSRNRATTASPDAALLTAITPSG